MIHKSFLEQEAVSSHRPYRITEARDDLCGVCILFRAFQNSMNFHDSFHELVQFSMTLRLAANFQKFSKHKQKEKTKQFSLTFHD